MQVLVNSDHTITGSESVTARVETIVRDALGRFGERIHRVEVHLSDVNGDKHGERDKRCLMEARLSGLKPIAASHQAPTLLDAMHAAAHKLERAVDRVLGRADSAKKRGAPEAPVESPDDLEEEARGTEP